MTVHVQVADTKASCRQVVFVASLSGYTVASFNQTVRDAYLQGIKVRSAGGTLSAPERLLHSQPALTGPHVFPACRNAQSHPQAASAA